MIKHIAILLKLLNPIKFQYMPKTCSSYKFSKSSIQAIK